MKLVSPSWTTLHEHAYLPIIRAYWTSTHQLLPSPRILLERWDQVNWNNVHKFMHRLPLGKQWWCTKHSSENCGIGKTLLAWELQLDNECPHCSQPEDTLHIYQCASPSATVQWNHGIDQLVNIMLDYQLPIPLQLSLITHLNDWRSGLPFLLTPSEDLELTTLVTSQDAIGWKNLLEGLPSTLWAPYIESLYKSCHIICCPYRTLQRLLHALHDLAWGQWEHRNHTLHDTEMPRHKRAISLLNQNIMAKYFQGHLDLPPPDHHHFHIAMGDLFTWSVSYQQAWYLNVTAARQRQAERVQAIEDERDKSFSNSQIIHWIRTGRLPWVNPSHPLSLPPYLSFLHAWSVC